MLLLLHLSVSYLLWAGLCLLATTHPAARRSRPWLATGGILLLVTEGCLCLTPAPWTPAQVTEFGIRCLLHSCFPGFIMAARALAVGYYDGCSEASAEILALAKKQNDDVRLALQTLHKYPAQGGMEDTMASMLENMTHVSKEMDTLALGLGRLQAKASKAGGYYWLVFVAMYMGFYLLGG